MTVVISPSSSVNPPAQAAGNAPSVSLPGTLSFTISGVADPANWCVSIGKSSSSPATHGAMSPVVDASLAGGFSRVGIQQGGGGLFTITVVDPGFSLAGFSAGDHLWLAFFTLSSPVSGTVPAAVKDLGVAVA